MGIIGATETIQHLGPPTPTCCLGFAGQDHLVCEDVRQGPPEKAAAQPLKVLECG